MENWKPKRQLITLLVFAVAISCYAQPASFTNGRTFRVEFFNPEQPTGVTYRAHISTNAALPVEQWEPTEFTPLLLSTTSELPGHSLMITSNRFPATLPLTFVSISVSNEWGIVFSEPLSTGPPRAGQRLRVTFN